ncbi:Uncharacterised protein [Vibrio cholerae]|nr:Uncharacterised protein [Vibrio cholerae]CSB79138.1 Uncharacterised protein [Vibrio cholerae]CSC07619.1 Uncharacterised protein [Vibrio cholerae]CSC80957.1 Uncharacterised protein [Vibrio cholerae]CSI02425.1 Uncharacterised protein [Vibrio cholerae]
MHTASIDFNKTAAGFDGKLVACFQDQFVTRFKVNLCACIVNRFAADFLLQ